MTRTSIEPVGASHANETAAKNTHLEFLLAHIDPRFEGDTNMEVGDLFIALAYPVIVVIGSTSDRQRCTVDVSQPDFYVEADCYPFKQFVERFPQVCERVVMAHEELSYAYVEWRNATNS